MRTGDPERGGPSLLNDDSFLPGGLKLAIPRFGGVDADEHLLADSEGGRGDVLVGVMLVLVQIASMLVVVVHSVAGELLSAT